jgi:hypothetical protein
MIPTEWGLAKQMLQFYLDFASGKTPLGSQWPTYGNGTQAIIDMKTFGGLKFSLGSDLDLNRAPCQFFAAQSRKHYGIPEI